MTFSFGSLALALRSLSLCSYCWRIDAARSASLPVADALDSLAFETWYAVSLLAMTVMSFRADVMLQMVLNMALFLSVG